MRFEIDDEVRKSIATQLKGVAWAVLVGGCAVGFMEGYWLAIVLSSTGWLLLQVIAHLMVSYTSG